MADKSFTSKQKEVVARKMGYEGPMNMFDEYLKSSPSDAQKYGTVVEKFMARGGMVRKYAVGGDVVVPTAATAGTSIIDPVTGMPTQPTAAQITPATQVAGADETINTQLAPAQASTVTPATAATTATAAAPTVTPAATMTATTAAPAVTTALEGVQAAQGTVAPQAQVQAAQVEPTTTAVGDLQAAQGLTTQVTGAPTRTLGAGELVSGTGVDQAAVEAALAKTQAAQGVVSEEMTTQGQLNKLLTDFDSGNPPAWAAASCR